MSGNLTSQELRRMVQSFRVHELQSLLAFANKNRFGRKQELQDRALELVSKQQNIPIQLKIKELFKMRSANTLPEPIYGSSSRDPYTSQSLQRSTASSNQSALSFMQQQSPRVGIVGGSIPGLGLGGHRMGNGIPPSIVERPSIKPIVLPFYDVISDPLLVPHTLWGNPNPQKYGDRECNFLFSIPVEHQKNISYNPDTMPLPRIELQMRFLPYDLTAEVKDDFPAGCVVRINDHNVTLPPTIPTNKPNVEPKRPSRPVMITQYCQRSVGQQKLTVVYSSKPDKHWTVSIYLVKRLTSQILLNRLVNKGARSPDYTRKQIIEKLTMASDIDIQAESHLVSVLCPLGKVRMTLPCRVRECKHLQCFDADLFLRMNEKKPTWVCPVCDQPAPFDKVVIDGYFHEVVRSLVQNGSPARDIEVFATGDWKAVLEEDDDDVPRKPSPKPTPQVVKVEPGPVASTSRSDSTPVTSPPEAICIDLISDDEDSTPQPPSRSTVVRPTNGNHANGARVSTPALNGVNESCSRSSGSPSIIVLDSPPSRPNATPEDPSVISHKRMTHSPISGFAPPLKKRLLSEYGPPPAHNQYPTYAQQYNSSTNASVASLAGFFNQNQIQQAYQNSMTANQPSTSSGFETINTTGYNSNSTVPHTVAEFNPATYAEISALESRVSQDLQNFLAACQGTNAHNFNR